MKAWTIFPGASPQYALSAPSIAGIKPQCLLKLSDCRAGLMLGIQRVPEIEMQIGIIRFQLQSFPEMGDRVIQLSRLGQRDPQKIMGVRVIGF